MITDMTEHGLLEEKLDRFFTFSQDLLSIVGLDGYFKRANPAFEKILGFTEDELLSQTFIAFVHPDDRVATLAQMQKMANGIDTICFENRYIGKNGSYRWFSWTCFAPLSGEMLVYIMGRDNADLRRAEEVLQEVHERFRGIYESSKDAIGYANLEGRLVDVNASFVALTGYSREELLAKTYQELTPPEYHQAEADIMKNIITTGQSFEYEKEYIRKNGSRVPILITAFAVKSRKGKPIGLAAVIKDITEHKHAEKVLRKQREELQIIIDSSPAMIFYKDKENRFIQVNMTFAETTGLPKGEIEGKSCFDIFPHQAKNYWEDDKEVMASGRPKTNIIEMLETKRGTRWVQTDKIPYKDERGNITGIIGFAIDITERKKAEEKIQHESEFLKTLLWNLKDGIVACNAEGVLTRFLIGPRRSFMAFL